jgi:hypothetical protein
MVWRPETLSSAATAGRMLQRLVLTRLTIQNQSKIRSLGATFMDIPENPVYVLKYTPHTITAIARALAAGQTGENVRHDVHVTSVEDGSVQKAAWGWRTISEDQGDRFIVEVEPGVPSSQFDLPFGHAVFFADKKQKELSRRSVSAASKLPT